MWDIGARLGCTRCGARNADTKPDWSQTWQGGSRAPTWAGCRPDVGRHIMSQARTVAERARAEDAQDAAWMPSPDRGGSPPARASRLLHLRLRRRARSRVTGWSVP